MKDILDALLDFQKSGYKINVVLPIEIKEEHDITFELVDNDKLLLTKDNNMLCTISIEKTNEKGQVTIELGNKKIIATDILRETCAKHGDYGHMDVLP